MTQTEYEINLSYALDELAYFSTLLDIRRVADKYLVDFDDLFKAWQNDKN